MKQYQCYICGYWAWSETLPDAFVDEHIHKSCAERLQAFEAYTRPWKERVEQDIAEADRLIAEGYSESEVEALMAERIARHPVLIPNDPSRL